ncbi:MAG: hypothetical protein K9M57_09705, partial [Phycisphaerae bacterium]|nr:hypothetical protein [Phycisphaerae bacterium]
DGFYCKDRCLSGEDTIFFMRIVINEKVMIIAPPEVRHHRENSDLSNVLRPLSPIVTTPEIVLEYCPKEKRDLMRRVIARLALRNARNRVRRTGLKEEAQALLHRFPEAQSFRFEYYRCRYEMALSSIFPYWVKFKCLVGPPVRLFVKKLARQLKRQDLMI